MKPITEQGTTGGHAMLTDAMRREIAVAEQFAHAAGGTLASLTPEKRTRCHNLARMVMPTVNRLIAAERLAVQRELGPRMAEATRRAASGAYVDGFADGQYGSFNNRWESEAEKRVDS